MTATEAIALAGIVLSGFLGYLSYRTAKEGRDDAHKLSSEAREAASAEARAARLFDARRTVYVDVMDYVYRIEAWVDRTEPFISFEGDPGPPPFPTDEEARRQSATVAAFCSPALLAKLNEYKQAARKFQQAVWALHDQKEQWKHYAELRDAGVNAPEPEDKERNRRKDITDTRAAVKAMVLEIGELVNAELAR